jgi:hypothetical protein
MQHGWNFNQRIREILAGRTFEPKHIHFFESWPKRDRIYIDSSTDEEIQKYEKTQRKASATRIETKKKEITYWKLYEELKVKAQNRNLEPEIRTDLEEFLRKNHLRRIPVDLRLHRLQRKSNELTVGRRN